MKRLVSIVTLSLSLLLYVTACVPPTPSSPSGKITEPANNAQVDTKDVIVSGTVKNIPSGSKVWLVVKIVKVNRYFPQDNPADVMTSGSWTSQIIVGQDTDHDLNAQIFLVAANADAQNAFNAYLVNARNKNDYAGLEEIPDGAIGLDTISVVKK